MPDYEISASGPPPP